MRGASISNMHTHHKRAMLANLHPFTNSFFLVLDMIYIQPRNDNIRHGSSLSAMVELANNAGYTLIETTLFNAFFILDDLYEKYVATEVPDTSIEALHEPTMGTELYQLYDGTIKLWGCKKMLWHRLPLDEKKMQILPAEERQFPFAPTANGDDNAQLVRQSNQIKEQAIDMSPYCETYEPTDNLDRAFLGVKKKMISSKLNDALQRDGFALVKGTGIPGTLCKDALQAAKSFLHEADESVRRSCLTKDRARRGYSPMCTENFASLIGEQGPNDLVKKFRIGPESTTDRTLSSLHQSNAWPSDDWGHDNASSFKSSIEDYFEQTCRAADMILQAIVDGIMSQNNESSESIKVLSESAASADGKSEVKNHTSILTLLGYQSGSRHKKGSKGYMRPLVHAHTDVGVITMLHFDCGRCASLQRAATRSNDNTWVDVELPPMLDDDPLFVINVGDCLSELSGGTVRSTLHRVVPRPCPSSALEDAARTCLALFVGLEPSAALELPTGEVLSYEQWRKQRIARAAAVLKDND